MVRAGGGAALTLADRPAALYRLRSYFRVGIADVRRKSEADVRLLRPYMTLRMGRLAPAAIGLDRPLRQTATMHRRAGLIPAPAQRHVSVQPDCSICLERRKCSQVVALDSIGDGFEIFDPIRSDLDENRLTPVVVTIRGARQRDNTVAGRAHDIDHPNPCNLNGGANLPTRMPAVDDPPILNGIDVRSFGIKSNSRNSVARHSANQVPVKDRIRQEAGRKRQRV
jgi:hypothetical protein